MKSFICTLFIASCFSVCLAKSDKEWEEFKGKYGKVYHHQQRESIRRQFWEEKDEQIQAHNANALNGDVTYTLVHNQFSDWSDLERATVKGAIADPAMNTASQEDLPLPMLRALPTSVDLRNATCMPPIQDQGNCGSCWSFSATAMVDFYNCKKKSNVLTKYSQQHLVSCDTVDVGCNGGFYTDAWDWLKTNQGQCTAAAYPYSSGSTAVSGTCKTCTKTATVTGFSWVSADATIIQNTLATVGPVSVAIDANSNLMQYASGVYADATCTKVVNHAVAIVGYGTWTDGTPYWIVRNSWGTGWGVNGYAYIKRGVNMCGIEAYAAYPIA